MSQLAFAVLDLASAEEPPRTATSLRRDFEKQIHTNEITQDALTTRRIAARIRSPSAPASVQIGFQVVMIQTNKVSELETMIFPSLPSGSPFRGDG